MDAIDVFHPDRMAQRILGMGDVLSLIEKAEQVVDEKEARKLAKKIRKNVFTLQDFLDQLQNIKKMGSMEQLMGMVPGINKLKQLQDAPVPNEKEMLKTEAIILSMTKKERTNYKIINASRRQRIAAGSDEIWHASANRGRLLRMDGIQPHLQRPQPRTAEYQWRWRRRKTC